MAIVRRVLLPILVMGLLWMVLVGGVSFTVEAWLGTHVAERLIPLLNVHLAEESLEGTYRPLSDWIFIVFSLFVAVVVFGLSGLFAAWRASERQRRIAGFAVLGVPLLHFSLLQVALGGTPAFRVAATAVFAASLVAFFAGVLLSRRSHVAVAGDA